MLRSVASRVKAYAKHGKLAAAHADDGTWATHAGDGHGQYHAGFVQRRRTVSRCRRRPCAHAIQAAEEGADLLDLGAESTRPGSRAGGADAAVSAEEEQARLLPVLEGILKARPHAVVSVDTYKAATARAALAAGAEIVNDVSGFAWDAGMAGVCAEFGAGVVLMHTRGRPEEWRAQPQLAPDALLATVREGLAASLAAARARGDFAEAIVLDPGYGFGKRFEENYALLARQAELLALGRPLLAGVSRKSFLGRTLAKLVWRQRAPIDRARDREPGGDGGGDSAWSVDCARSCGAAGGGGGADCGYNSSKAVNKGTRGRENELELRLSHCRQFLSKARVVEIVIWDGVPQARGGNAQSAATGRVKWGIGLLYRVPVFFCSFFCSISRISFFSMDWSLPGDFCF